MPTSDFIQQIKEEKNRVPFLFIEEIGDFSSDFQKFEYMILLILFVIQNNDRYKSKSL